MGRGQHRAVSGVAVAALSGVLAGGASLVPGVADAAPARPAPPPECVIGTTTYTQPQLGPNRRPVEALGAAEKCVDAIKDNVLGLKDLVAYGLRPTEPVAAATPTTPKPTTTTPTTTTPQPRPATPSTPKPTTTTPQPTTTTPADTPAVTAPSPTSPAGQGAGKGTGKGTGKGEAPPPAQGSSPSADVVPTSPDRVATPEARPVAAAAAAPVAAQEAPLAPAVVPPAAAPEALPAITDAPVGDAIPLDSPLLDPVMPAALLEPLGAPGLASLPGETGPLQTLGGDVSAVTTSSQVQALGLDGLQRGAGLPAVVGVTILSGLGGFALRHRILARIRATTAGAPAPDDLDDDLGGRHSA